MTEHVDELTRGRAALRESKWSEAYETFSELDRLGSCHPKTSSCCQRRRSCWAESTR
jgi:hypothetical protein